MTSTNNTTNDCNVVVIHDDNNTTISRPTNGLVTPLLTDLYQITMTYAHWKNGRQNDPAVFELFFRKNPFGGEYTIFAGLDEVLKFLTYYKFTENDIQYLKHNVPVLQHCDEEFFDWLLQLDTRDVKIRALQDGTVAFPRVPLLIIEAPLGIGQLIETTLLTLVNYPSLIATNAARMVVAASSLSAASSFSDDFSVLSINEDSEDDMKSKEGFTKSKTTTTTADDVLRRISSTASLTEIQRQSIYRKLKPAQCSVIPICIEFGLRRAQGPDGGFSGSKYSSIGGFVATSNVQAGKLLNLKISGTHAHAYVQAYSTLQEVFSNAVVPKKVTTSTTDSTEKHAEPVPLLPLVLQYRNELARRYDASYLTTNDGELAAFIAYATAFPDSFLCLIDTYDTLKSGLLNFVLVTFALYELGYQAMGIRLDSGDLAYLSMECAKVFHVLAEETPLFAELSIVASNDINEEVLHALHKQEHAITAFGIGTNLVTCQAQPALGCVYKLVELSGKPRIKLSQEISKVLIPSRKRAYRLIGKDGRPILDLLVADHEPAPTPGQRIMCRHAFVARKRAIVTPSRVELLVETVFANGKPVPGANRTLQQARVAVQQQLAMIRPDILRYTNPTPYKVSVSEALFDQLHDLWQAETPVAELS